MSESSAMGASSLPAGFGTAYGTARTSIPILIASRVLRFLASPELLVFSYTLSVLSSVKEIVYAPLMFSLLGMKWRISAKRIVYYLLFAAATAIFFVTKDNINATGAFLLVALGLFAANTGPRRAELEHKITAYATVIMLFAFYELSDAFDVNVGVVSRNFIPIIGLYILVTSLAWTRREIVAVAIAITIMVFSVGSRSGTAVFVVLSALIVSRRLALVMFGCVFLVYVADPDIAVVPSQFERGYDTDADPRLFIWAEFADNAVAGTLFRKESFAFMDTFGLERNFHNSVLEAYYRLGPVAILLLVLHFRLLRNTWRNPVAFWIFAAVFVKAMFDTYLWFTPVDLILFTEYGRRVLAVKETAVKETFPSRLVEAT